MLSVSPSFSATDQVSYPCNITIKEKHYGHINEYQFLWKPPRCGVMCQCLHMYYCQPQNMFVSFVNESYHQALKHMMLKTQVKMHVHILKY